MYPTMTRIKCYGHHHETDFKTHIISSLTPSLICRRRCHIKFLAYTLLGVQVYTHSGVYIHLTLYSVSVLFKNQLQQPVRRNNKHLVAPSAAAILPTRVGLMLIYTHTGTKIYTHTLVHSYLVTSNGIKPNGVQ